MSMKNTSTVYLTRRDGNRLPTWAFNHVEQVYCYGNHFEVEVGDVREFKNTCAPFGVQVMLDRPREERGL